MNNARGTNQYQKKSKSWSMTEKVMITMIVSLFLGYFTQKPTIVSPCPESGCSVEMTKVHAEELSAKVELARILDEESKPTKTNIIAYIAKTFEKEGTAVQVRAIRCFYSESGLRTEAYNWNPSSNSEDIGVAQVNLKYHPDVNKADMHDFRKNITKAYKIFVGRGHSFDAWYGKDCK